MARDAYTQKLIDRRKALNAAAREEQARYASEWRNKQKQARADRDAGATRAKPEPVTARTVVIKDLTGTYPDMMYPVWTPPPGRQRAKRSNRT